MAIVRPEATDAAPKGPQRSGGRRRAKFLASRGMRGTRRGRKFVRPSLRLRRSRRSRPSARSSHHRGRSGPRAPTVIRGERWRPLDQAARRQRSTAKDRLPWRAKGRTRSCRRDYDTARRRAAWQGLIEFAGQADETRIDRIRHDDPGQGPSAIDLFSDGGEATYGLLWLIEEAKRGVRSNPPRPDHPGRGVRARSCASLGQEPFPKGARG